MSVDRFVRVSGTAVSHRPRAALANVVVKVAYAVQLVLADHRRYSLDHRDLAGLRNTGRSALFVLKSARVLVLGSRAARSFSHRLVVRREDSLVAERRARPRIDVPAGRRGGQRPLELVVPVGLSAIGERELVVRHRVRCCVRLDVVVFHGSRLGVAAWRLDFVVAARRRRRRLVGRMVERVVRVRLARAQRVVLAAAHLVVIVRRSTALLRHPLVETRRLVYQILHRLLVSP